MRANLKGNLWHPGITMHKIHVGGDVGGLLFVLASTAAVLVGVPTMWYFFAAAIGSGIVIAALLNRLHG
ncbi:MAG TPA: hypothetical protein VKD24_07905 [Candidatus Angelobacter sp.]|jgi:hypothetical protein|nr:hypothetical protein [Candidatus Angelobacter sp.]